MVDDTNPSSAESSYWLIRSVRMREERNEARTQTHENELLKNKNKQKPAQKGKNRRQAGDCCTVNITHTQRKTMDQHRTTDTRRLNRDTNEGNKGDTGGATETMIR